MNTKLLTKIAVCLLSLALPLLADASLKSALSLDIEQARKVSEIQGEHREPFVAKRGEQNRELRKLRRAKIANDSQQIAAQERIVDRLHMELKQIQMDEDAAIRRLLSPAQVARFEAYLKLRKEMVGSSRDAKDF